MCDMTTTTATPTLSHYLGRAVAWALVAILAALLAVLFFGGPQSGPLPVAQRPDAVGSPTALIREHGCWTGSAPADMVGKMPGHVVVTVGGKTVYSAKYVGPALEQIFAGKASGLTVHAFCR